MAHTITHFTPDVRRRLDGLVDRVGKAVNGYIDGQPRGDDLQLPEAEEDLSGKLRCLAMLRRGWF